MADDRRLIEDYLPIEAISAEASREKSVRKGHLSTLHLWWARRPLVACRAAVYASLVQASRFSGNDAAIENKTAKARERAASFVAALCTYPGSAHHIAQAQDHILSAHAERLSRELDDCKAGKSEKPDWVGEFNFDGTAVTKNDIVAGKAPRPRVLDIFAGGGAIPLEALRLGCDAYALELNPVAYLIELCTLVYPQKYGKADVTVRGMTGPKGKGGQPTWGGLANEVRYWGEWLIQKIRTEIGDIYPLIPDPKFRGRQTRDGQEDCFKAYEEKPPPGYLAPLAYLWTRTVTCKNPNCGATVPLVKQTWLSKKSKRYVALKMIAPHGKKQVRFEVVEARTEKELGFDPSGFSDGGNATCPFCGTVADDEYVQIQGMARAVGTQLLAVACARPGAKGKVYIAASSLPENFVDENQIANRIAQLTQQSGLSVPNERINAIRPSPNARGLSAVTRHGIATFGDLFTSRQKLCLLTACAVIRQSDISEAAGNDARNLAISTYLAGLVDKTADYGSAFCRWISQTEAVAGTFGRHALPMLWDFAEIAPFGTSGSNMRSILEAQIAALRAIGECHGPASVRRGSATSLPLDWRTFDAVITDPPYYDNVPYADISDFFYVWQKRSIGHLYPAEFASELTPKKSEATALSSRYGGNMQAANKDYEQKLLNSFLQATRLLKPTGEVVVVYAHKTTLGWATLVDALRRANLTVVEAWPFDTERSARLLALDTASLASSIFLVAQKRFGAQTGKYEAQIRPELEQIVRERVTTLWDAGLSGADLVIACVGAGLRAFTRFARVEYANGEEVPAERFLAEVETVVLETILRRLSNITSADEHALAGVDVATRFYLLWRFTYKNSDIEAGEAFIFANGTHAKLDGANGLSTGPRALVHKNKGKYQLRDYSDRGANEKLAIPTDQTQNVPLIDALHRTLWLIENQPRSLVKFLAESGVNRDQLRLLAQALAGPALRGGELTGVSPTAELGALSKLVANWRSIVEDAVTSAQERHDRRTGQRDILRG